jgi:hypothetical protein
MRINTHIRHSKEFCRDSLSHKYQSVAQGWETFAFKEYAGELTAHVLSRKSATTGSQRWQKVGMVDLPANKWKDDDRGHISVNTAARC